VDLFIERDELAEGGAGEVLDVAEVQQQFQAAQLIDQAEKLFADHLDILLIENLFIGKVHDGNVADVFHFQPAATRLRGHVLAPSAQPPRTPAAAAAGPACGKASRLNNAC